MDVNPEVGKLVMGAAADSNLKKVTLELGGKSPNIVFGDADMATAVEQAHFALLLQRWGSAAARGVGRSWRGECTTSSWSGARSRAQKRTVGNPFDAATEQGPQIDEEQLGKILGLIESGKKEGARLVAGGGRAEGDGYFVQPTVFADVQDHMRIAQEEIFGPVMQVIRFDGMEDLVEKANNTIYGLAAAVVTQDLDKALYVANNIRAGTVWVNCYDAFDAGAPFGGYKQSGIGRELGEYGLDAYTEVKCVTMKVPQKNS